MDGGGADPGSAEASMSAAAGHGRPRDSRTDIDAPCGVSGVAYHAGHGSRTRASAEGTRLSSPCWWHCCGFCS